MNTGITLPRAIFPVSPVDTHGQFENLLQSNSRNQSLLLKQALNVA